MGEKRCCTCGEIKPLDEFNRLKRANDGRQPRCRQCHKDWHADNREHHNALIRKRNKRLRTERRRLMLEYLSSHPCVDCGETDPLVLEFDHVRDKRHNVGEMISRGDFSWESILREIEKCEVVCANCHRRRTYRRQGSYRLEYLPASVIATLDESGA
jgi:hypothetical protein